MAGPIATWGFEYEYRCAEYEYEYEYEQIQRVWDPLGRDEHRTRGSIFIHSLRLMAGPIVAWGFEYEYRCAEYEYEYEKKQRVWDLLGREEHRSRTRESRLGNRSSFTVFA